jgi:hypothetical protein
MTGEHRLLACWFRLPAETDLGRLSTSSLQPARMPSAVKDRKYPHFLFADDVIDSIELETMYRRPAHVRKSDSMKQC